MKNVENSYKIIFLSGEDEIEISPEAECRLVENGVSGLSSTGFDVKISSYASNVGGYAQRRRFAEREISLAFEIVRGDENRVRRKLVSMMNPMKDCVLDIEMFGVHRLIDVIPYEEADFSRSTFYDATEAVLRFIAPAVFFRDTEVRTIRFRDSAPMLTFPMNFMADAGTVSGVYRTTDRTAADNPGDYECGITAVIRASGGDIVNPGIKCGDKFVKCPLTLSDGDELMIDTRPRMKNIYKNGERCFTFDKNSVFLTLPAGKSDFSVICDTGGEYIDAYITFTPLYFGM